MKEQGKHISLVPLEGHHAEVTLKWRSSDRAALLNKGATTVEEQKKWIEARPSNEFNFIIELKNGQPVGMLSLIHVDRQNRSAESARFLIGEEEAVHGIPVAAEAMLLLYELAFTRLELNRIYGTIAAENRLMIKWQKYLGMAQEGVLREHYFIDNKFQDAVIMGILRKDYLSSAKKKLQVLAK
jgi:RimJ/RimL family protein N-acetyltransferase